MPEARVEPGWLDLDASTKNNAQVLRQTRSQRKTCEARQTAARICRNAQLSAHLADILGMRSDRTDNKKRHAILEEYLFGDLDLPHEVPSLQDLMTITVRRRNFRPDEQALALVLPQR